MSLGEQPDGTYVVEASDAEKASPGAFKRYCAYCGKSFTGVDRKRYCGPSCRLAAFKERKRWDIIRRHLDALNLELRANGFKPYES